MGRFIIFLHHYSSRMTSMTSSASLLLLLITWVPFLATASPSSGRSLVIGVDGGTESIRACVFDAATGETVGKPCAIPYTTYHPKPGWAEQDPSEWWDNLGQAVRGALASLADESASPNDVRSICVDTTCCSVVVLDSFRNPLRRCLLWMDARSASQTVEIMDKCKGDPALDVNCGGNGPISAEWMTPKALWIKQNEPDIWSRASTICEYQDWINYRLTGRIVTSSCNTASRWHWNGEECLKKPSKEDPYPGRPISLYKKLGMPELVEKMPSTCLPMGDVIGGLTRDAAKHLGLPEGLPIIQGGPDAFVGMIGLGCIHPGQLCLITGSSHLHCIVTSEAKTAAGTWGAYSGAPLSGLNFAEGGQSSTGSIMRWAKDLFAGTESLEYETLDREATSIPPGAEGLVALETFQGSRTPQTDPVARGAMVGLTLSHTRAHLWRAQMEAVCFGTRACIEGLANAGHSCDEIIIAGGATKSPLWLQMHADVTGKPVVLCEVADAPLLGCAVLASVGAGLHNNVEDAVQNMVRTAQRIEPRRDIVDVYTKLYDKVYSKLPEAVRPVVHAIAALRGGSEGVVLSNSIANDSSIIISPSLLASDWSDIRAEINRCVRANCQWIHVDVFDGVFLDSPFALTFGPQMVKAIHDYADQASFDLILDIHLCVDRPPRYVQAMADAGATRIIFQWEAMESTQAATQMAEAVNDAGLKCGVSINPATNAQDIIPLLESGLVDLVDVLAVEPGFGGQPFQEVALTKLKILKSWKEVNGADIKLLVDGGINDRTSLPAKAAGADILVAGTFLFRHKISFATGVKELQRWN